MKAIIIFAILQIFIALVFSLDISRSDNELKVGLDDRIISIHLYEPLSIVIPLKNETLTIFPSTLGVRKDKRLDWRRECYNPILGWTICERNGFLENERQYDFNAIDWGFLRWSWYEIHPSQDSVKITFNMFAPFPLIRKYHFTNLEILITKTEISFSLIIPEFHHLREDANALLFSYVIEPMKYPNVFGWERKYVEKNSLGTVNDRLRRFDISNFGIYTFGIYFDKFIGTAKLTFLNVKLNE